jgi:hypothetical protein
MFVIRHILNFFKVACFSNGDKNLNEELSKTNTLKQKFISESDENDLWSSEKFCDLNILW